MERVLALAQRIRQAGLEPVLDRYAEAPPEGWVRWLSYWLENADYVLTVCTPLYRRRFSGQDTGELGRGVTWEGAMLSQLIYDAGGRSDRIIPVVFSGDDRPSVPTILRGFSVYDLGAPTGSLYSLEQLLARLRQRMAPAPSPASQPTDNLPRRGPFFTGREALLCELRTRLGSGGSPVALTGLGGVGKSALAREYAHRYGSAYRTVLWVHAATRQRMEESCTQLWSYLRQAEHRVPDGAGAFEGLRGWLERERGWLLILDQVGSVDLVEDLLPAAPGGSIIMTTRSAQVGPARRLQVGPLSPGEGALLLLRHTTGNVADLPVDPTATEEYPAAFLVALELDGLPLALEQAGDFIVESSLSITEYLTAYRSDGESLRAAGRTQSETTVAEVWRDSLAELAADAPASAELLRLMAFMGTEPVPEAVAHTYLTRWVGASGYLQVRAHLTALCRSSLVSRDPSTRTFRVHRLVQSVMRDTMDKKDRRRWAAQAVEVLAAVAEGGADAAGLQPHLQAAAGFISEYQIQTRAAAVLLHRLGRLYRRRGEYGQVGRHLELALDLYRLTEGADGPGVAAVLFELGSQCHNESRYAEAQRYFSQGVSVLRQALGTAEMAWAQATPARGDDPGSATDVICQVLMHLTDGVSGELPRPHGP